MILLPLLLAAPVQAADDPPVTIEFIEYKDTQISMKGASFVAVVALTRTGGPPLTLTDLDATLTLNGQPVGTSLIEDERIKLPKNQAVLVEIPATISLAAGPAVMKAFGSDDLDLRAEGTIQARGLIFKRSFDFERDL
ncbi:MAG: hypothetical protein ACI9VR_001978 [Cognaticolwellia sp.]